jgi:hypothetical protein
MADRELKLNSISRFAKQSARLVLEEHGPCEVPAGCGAVILRWRGPADPVPVKLWVLARGDYQAFLDGTALSSARPLVSPGQHVLALRLERSTDGELVLMFAGLTDEKHLELQASPGTEPPALILSRPDGSWLYTTEEPADDTWMRPGFDASNWPAMVPEAPPQSDPERAESYWIDRMQEDGAQPIGVSSPVNTIWVRKEFHLTARKRPEVGWIV